MKSKKQRSFCLQPVFPAVSLRRQGDRQGAYALHLLREEGLYPLRLVFGTLDDQQIELRLLAHISGDQAMQEAFLSGEDFHTVTAAHVFGVPIEQVTANMRHPPVCGDDLQKAVHIGTFQLGVLPVLQHLAHDGVLAPKLVQHLRVGGVAGLSMLGDRVQAEASFLSYTAAVAALHEAMLPKLKETGVDWLYFNST